MTDIDDTIVEALFTAQNPFADTAKVATTTTRKPATTVVAGNRPTRPGVLRIRTGRDNDGSDSLIMGAPRCGRKGALLVLIWTDELIHQTTIAHD